MPLRKPVHRFPRRFNRPISDRTRSLVARRHKKRATLKRERIVRWFKRSLRLTQDWGAGLRRWLLLLALSVLLLFLGMMLFSPIMQVREIRVARNDARLDVEQVQRILGGLFGRHLLFVSDYEVRSLLTASIDDIDQIVIHKEYPSILALRIELDPLIARLSIDDPEAIAGVTTGTGAVTYDYLTEEGTYVSYPSTQGEENLLVLQLVDWGARPISGVRLLSLEFLDRLRGAEHALATQFGHTITGRTVFLRAREFHIHTDRFSVWFDGTIPLDDQLQRYRTFLRRIGPDEVRQYIDLRLSNMVVYQ